MRLTKEFNNILKAHKSRLGAEIRCGNASKMVIRKLARETYHQEKWPSHIAHVYLNLDAVGLRDPNIIKYVLSIIRAENLGVGSKGLSHRDLAVRFAKSVGISERSLDRSVPCSANQALMSWCDMSALDRTWQESLAVHLACEAQFELMEEIRAGLKSHYSVSSTNILLWTVHAGPVERRHAREGFSIIENHNSVAQSNRLRDSIVHNFTFTCQLLRVFYDSILEDSYENQ